MSEEAASELLRKTIDEGRIEILLQPIVTLPQRKIYAYEVLSRLKTSKGETLLPEDFLGYMQKGMLGITFDTLVLYRAAQLVRRMQTRNKEIGVVVNLCASTLAGGEEFSSLVEFLAANRALSSSLTLEISQGAYQKMGAPEFENMHAISQLGFSFSLDQVRDLRFDIKGLFDRGFRFVKVSGGVLLDRNIALPANAHPANFSDLLARQGIMLVADRIEAEAAVIDLLDYGVPFAQGFLFASPRPVKAEVLDDETTGGGPKAALSA
jgi:cyclic-di-GMP phosphodiesterase TipF (flagellum assembly factor)